MSEQWYYATDGRQNGPVEARALKQLAADGRLRPDDLVWKDGMKDWVPTSSVKGLVRSSTEATPPLASEPPSRAFEGSGNPIYTLKGLSEVLAVFEDKLTITPRGALGSLVKGHKGSKAIPFSCVSAIRFKEAGPLFNGFIQFSIPGGKESGGGIFTALLHENTFLFTGRDKNAQASAIIQFIEAAMRKSRGPQPTAGAASVSDELQKLAQLRDQEILSDEEFQSAKRKLIG